ncbi:MAG: ABC transporter permease [Candidatus Cloacimonetes bacterium]|nr:ABC transporter permease [Candidatus Cloacimonadota bacterium]MBL7148997.1 ABC transporter permease [Candidatus Cloacimonadota bacterium]
MFKNYFKLALRNIVRQKGFSFINIVGLAIGLACCLIILLFIQYEFSYEEMHHDLDNIYRVLTIDKAMGTNSQRVGITIPALGPSIPEAFSEVEDFLRVTNQGQLLVSFEENPFVYIQNLCSADENIFDFFGFKLLEGDPESALREPYTVVLTKSEKARIFGEENSMNKTIRTGNGYDLTVTGIMEDLPANTHLSFTAIQSFTTRIAQARQNQPPDSNQPIWIESWQMIAMPTYIRLKEGFTSEGMDERLTAFCRENEVGENFDITLQALDDVHLRSTDIIFDSGISNKGDINYIYIFAAIALLVLLIASVNYMNLSTAKSMQRAKEVGMRKVVGSVRSQLINQFLGESLTLTLLALLLAIPLVEIVLPWLNDLGGTGIRMNFLENHVISLFMVALLIVVGIISGIYPAFVLSGFKPVTVLKGSFKSGKKGTTLRTVLVIFQFALSIALIGSTAVVQKQLKYIKNKDLGYNREQVILFDMQDNLMSENIELLQEELKKHSAFEKVAIAGNVPGRTFGRTGVNPEGAVDDDIWIMSRVSLSADAIDALGMEIVLGENFLPEITRENFDVIINETAVRQLGWDNPLEKRFFFGPQDSTGVAIRGIIKDFHFIEMQQNIEPVIIFPQTRGPGNIVVARIAPGQTEFAMEHVRQVWKDVYPDHPLSFSFMDDEFNSIYHRDEVTSKIVNVFSGLAIFIACLGLLGLASFAIAQRRKEIGIRKTMGASSLAIVKILTFSFMKWVLVANLIAWPLIYFSMSKWLQNFAYRTEMDIWVFLISSLIGIMIALITISLQTFKAANANPVDALKYE